MVEMNLSFGNADELKKFLQTFGDVRLNCSIKSSEDNQGRSLSSFFDADSAPQFARQYGGNAALIRSLKPGQSVEVQAKAPYYPENAGKFSWRKIQMIGNGMYEWRVTRITAAPARRVAARRR